MPKVRRSSSLSLDRSRASPYPCTSEDAEQYKLNNPFENSENGREWEDARCPICMEHPHNAVLIKCSSHEKGCRPYMCNTSHRHSNCLDQFCKSSEPDSSTVTLQELPLTHTASHNAREEELLPGQSSPCGSQVQPNPVCPLCRGEIYGYIVLEAARHFMNSKVRSCSSETCEFSGTYSELRTHARSEHPYVRPSEVDPNRHRDWMRLERQRDWEDVLSIVTTGSTDDIVLDPSNDVGWMTSVLTAMFRSFEQMIFTYLLENASGEEETDSRGSGRTSRDHYDNDTIPTTRRSNIAAVSTSHPRRLLRWRALDDNLETSPTPRWNHSSVSGETDDTSRWSNNSSLEETSRTSRWGNNNIPGEGTSRALRRGNNSITENTRWDGNFVSGNNRPTGWGINSIAEEGSRAWSPWPNSSISEDSRHGHRWGNNSTEESGHGSRRSNASVPESTPLARGLRWRNQRWSTNNNRR